MSDEEYVNSIAKMSAVEILVELREAPYYLTDGYYRSFMDALTERMDQLIKESEDEASKDT